MNPKLKIMMFCPAGANTLAGSERGDTLKLGSTIEWKSQVGEREKVKTGTVVRILPGQGTKDSLSQSPRALAEKEFPGHRPMFDGWEFPDNMEIGYFVEVRDEEAGRALPELYMLYLLSLSNG